MDIITNLEALPTDIIYEVCRSLGISDLDSLEKISHRFSSLLSQAEWDVLWKIPFEREYQRFQDLDYLEDTKNEVESVYGLCNFFYPDGLMSDEETEFVDCDAETIEWYKESRERRKKEPDIAKALRIVEMTSWRARAKLFLKEENRLIEIVASFIESSNPPATLEQIRQTESRLDIVFPRPIMKLYLQKNGGKIKHCPDEEIFPLDQLTVRSPVEYCRMYLNNLIEGSNKHGIFDIESFVKENEWDSDGAYWNKWICFIKGVGRTWNTGLFFMFFNGHAPDRHEFEEIWALWEHTDPSGNGAYHKSHCNVYRNGSYLEKPRLMTFLKELTTLYCRSLPY